MYKNTVNLIGFLGNDATIHTGNNRSFTTLSLATKSSYKDKKSGEYVSHTEWHNCIVFGKLATFAGSLKKGAHVEIDGELRSREFTSKKTNATTRVWEIKVKSILKLDRAEQAAAEEAEFDETEEFATEDVAA
jgi:single-strand DNA-binding protein